MLSGTEDRLIFLLQGVLGTLLIRLNVAAAVYRRNSIISEWPLLEVVVVASATAALSYLVIFTR